LYGAEFPDLPYRGGAVTRQPTAPDGRLLALAVTMLVGESPDAGGRPVSDSGTSAQG
jgi:hypothetical protein